MFQLALRHCKSTDPGGNGGNCLYFLRDEISDMYIADTYKHLVFWGKGKLWVIWNLKFTCSERLHYPFLFLIKGKSD